jgi:hypothetical protein
VCDKYEKRECTFFGKFSTVQFNVQGCKKSAHDEGTHCAIRLLSSNSKKHRTNIIEGLSEIFFSSAHSYLAGKIKINILLNDQGWLVCLTFCSTLLCYYSLTLIKKYK